MNFVVIVVDDQRLDSLDYMPLTRGWLQAGGREFTQARCNQPLCGPARTGLITGQYTKDHDIFDHTGSLWNDWWTANANNTIAEWLSDEGYRCGFLGKYNPLPTDTTETPPTAYDLWKRIQVVGLVSDSQPFNVWDGSSSTAINEYQTEWLADESSTFMAGAEPWSLFVAPTAPHWPAGPHPDDLFAWSWVDWDIVDETDVSDKPAWLSGADALTDADKRQIKQDVRGQLRELASIDRMVDTICTAADFSDTMIVYTSDNGVFYGEHRITGPATKDAPYDPCLRVPLLVRGPGFTAGQTDRLVTQQDITATIVAAANATAGLPNQAGVDLRDVQDNPAGYDDRVLLHECGTQQAGAESDGVTTGPHHATLAARKLFRYPSVRADPDGPFTYEAYDLDTDPGEHSNWADDAGRISERNALEAELDDLLV